MAADTRAIMAYYCTVALQCQCGEATTTTRLVAYRDGMGVESFCDVCAALDQEGAEANGLVRFEFPGLTMLMHSEVDTQSVAQKMLSELDDADARRSRRGIRIVD